MAVPPRRNDARERGRVLLLTNREAPFQGLLKQVRARLEFVDCDSAGFDVGSKIYDVAVIDLCQHATAALAVATRLCRQDPATEVVLFAAQESAPEVMAVRMLGFTNLVTGTEGHDWLIRAMPALVRVARARRDMREAESAVPPRPDATAPGELDLPLPVAESRFRETYLRALVAATGSRSCAAERAGIPYRTLCKILQRLNIEPPGSLSYAQKRAEFVIERRPRRLAVLRRLA